MQKIIVGNWKLNLDHLEAISHLQKINYSLSDKILSDVNVVVAPSHTSLRSIQTVIDTDNLKIETAAQDVSQYEDGPYTGEVSSLQLSKLNIKWAIIGHSERRINFDETNEIINKKLKNLLKNNIQPILCIGEDINQRDQDKHIDTCIKQVQETLKGIRKDNLQKVIVAYEPIWAIGTGIVAKPEHAVEIISEIKRFLTSKSFDLEQFQFIYGGSVDSDNAKGFMVTDSIDGFLVGGSSLSSDEFVRIIKLSI